MVFVAVQNTKTNFLPNTLDRKGQKPDNNPR